MSQNFDYFVIFAEMRTGSNFLEENVNSYPGLKCWGEIYNPRFIGKSNRTELEGVTLAQREAEPFKLLERLRERTDGLAGFRYFHDHDLRVCGPILDDPRCGKIILTRNPLESYVSRKIAAQTGQWRLGDLKDARTAKVDFDKKEFETMLEEVKGFQLHLLRRLQLTGQTAYYIAYEDIQDIEVLNGLAKYLGVDAPRTKTIQKTKVQNPARLEDKVLNFPAMVTALSDIDHFNLANTPNFEPRRGPAVPTFVAAKGAPLLYMPLRGGPQASVTEWLSRQGRDAGLETGFTQKTLRKWKRSNTGHRSFTVTSHPVARLHRSFCQHIVNIGPESFGEIREQLRTTYKLPLPIGAPDDSYTLDRHRVAFLGFADFVKGNLNGQTSIRVDGSWASQSEVIKGFGEFALPDNVLREDELDEGLSYLARSVGYDLKDLPAPEADTPYSLEEVYTPEIESAVRAAYQRDYMIFGFGEWERTKGA